MAEHIMAPAYIDTKSAATYLNLHRDTLRRLRRVGGGPKYIRVPGTTAIRYDIEELRRWMSERTYSHAAEEVSRAT